MQIDTLSDEGVTLRAGFTRGRSLVRSQVRPWLYEGLVPFRSAFDTPRDQ
jgi:hypothetical protein